MRSTHLWLIPLTLYLSACSVAKDHFDCPAGQGVGCHSISEVNARVNRGTLEDVKSSTKKGIDLKPGINYPGTMDEWIPDAMHVERIKEAHLRVWIAPFQDEQGHFHEASIIHTVLKPGFWEVQEGV